MEFENIMEHYGTWWGAAFFIVLFGLFIVFTPFYKKSQRKSTSAYLAFVVAFAIEMHGIPFSMYLVSWIFGKKLPEGIFWGHTLQQYIGHWGMYAAIVVFVIGFILVYFGWRNIYKNYWSKDEGKGKLVTNGIYAYIRHPQYTGFLLISLGMIFEWATIPLIIMFPFMIMLYYRLAKREEKDMEKEFGNEYVEYKKRTSMFLPSLKLSR